MAGLAVLFVSQLEKSALGRSIQAIREDENLARSMGIEVVRLSCAHDGASAHPADIHVDR